MNVLTSNNEIVTISKKYYNDIPFLKKRFDTLKSISNDRMEEPLQLNNISTEVLNKIIKFVDFLSMEEDNSSEKYNSFIKDFFNVEKEFLFDLCNAVDFLKYRPLLDACVEEIVEKMKDFNATEIKEFLCLNNAENPSSMLEMDNWNWAVNE
eukprot:TRINITY_DN1074_c0_g1_i1.p1 TRINITY_DN1074_c0_g1~~TRINITY_DN1074_c0_g1_i1.p1  ORF type:complete len:160 (-),score=56.08 TRINITY_DN1074_c0_g1_i1:93-548(-)